MRQAELSSCGSRGTCKSINELKIARRLALSYFNAIFIGNFNTPQNVYHWITTLPLPPGYEP